LLQGIILFENIIYAISRIIEKVTYIFGHCLVFAVALRFKVENTIDSIFKTTEDVKNDYEDCMLMQSYKYIRGPCRYQGACLGAMYRFQKHK
jgi:hypothetical protein